MRNLWKYFILGMILTLSFGAGWIIRFGGKRPTVLSETITVSISPTLTPTIIPSPSPSPSPTPTPTIILSEPEASPSRRPTPVPSSTPTPTSQPAYSQEEIHGFIERFAGQYAVDPNILRHIAVCESGFNASSQNLLYAGLYQFSPGSWTRYRARMGEDSNSDLRFNAEEAVQTAAYVLFVNEAYIWPNCAP